ncbi:MarR family winged helix-turn-helix transcriptional regulator [Paenibacillus sp. 481]|uniref:MarR family winged helix-turn-helix transcriptional regulator n=1 Tax=Paenibacillus sp. 481 TaxID=2835869 RepID=UPI001E4AEDDE|nr:MarR family transcriptional regulator [Paenibacillus sp. 481]UHA75384.1 MarR family transcriptional regulator [Paenibacillus sp. 481]
MKDSYWGKIIEEWSLFMMNQRNLMKFIDHHIHHELNTSQSHALWLIYMRAELNMTELAGHMQMSKQQLTPIVNKLIELGYATREYNAADRRVINIRITPAGTDLVKECDAEIATLLKHIMSDVDEQELLAFQQSLHSMNHTIDRIMASKLNPNP